jgi:hypothetical protein
MARSIHAHGQLRGLASRANYLSRNTKRKVKTAPRRVATVGLRPFLVNDMALSSTTKGLNFKWFAQEYCFTIRVSLGLSPSGTRIDALFSPGVSDWRSFFLMSTRQPLLVYSRGGRAGQNIRLDRSHLIGFQQVLERGHSKLLASAAQHDGLELKVGCGAGVAQVRNARA